MKEQDADGLKTCVTRDDLNIIRKVRKDFAALLCRLSAINEFGFEEAPSSKWSNRNETLESSVGGRTKSGTGPSDDVCSNS